MKLTLEIKAFEVGEGEEKDLEVEVDYTPARPAPACSNHDSPAFSDSGDPDELEVLCAVVVKDGQRFPLQKKVLDDDRFCDAVLEAARGSFREVGSSR